MRFKKIRNLIVTGLSGHLGIPVVLANQVNPEQEYPFVVYSTTATYLAENTLGDYQIDAAGAETRKEQPTSTWSFTVCSANRRTTSGFVLGDDEAMETAEKALGWFLHVGYDYMLKNGITIVDSGNVQERSVLQVDEEARRYGFDITIRYVREDVRQPGLIEHATATRKG